MNRVKKDPFSAVLLSFLPGLGHVYVGKFLRLWFWYALLAAILIIYHLFDLMQYQDAIYLAGAIYGVWHLAVAIDASWFAATPEGVVAKYYQHPIYLLLAVFPLLGALACVFILWGYSIVHLPQGNAIIDTWVPRFRAPSDNDIVVVRAPLLVTQPRGASVNTLAIVLATPGERVQLYPDSIQVNALRFNVGEVFAQALNDSDINTTGLDIVRRNHMALLVNLANGNVVADFRRRNLRKQFTIPAQEALVARSPLAIAHYFDVFVLIKRRQILGSLVAIVS